MMIFLYILLVVELAVSIFVVWNLVRKLDTVSSDNEDLYNTMVEIYGDLHRTFKEMKAIDHRGGFEAEDETGAIFKDLKSVIDKLEDKYGTDNV